MCHKSPEVQQYLDATKLTPLLVKRRAILSMSVVLACSADSKQLHLFSAFIFFTCHVHPHSSVQKLIHFGVVFIVLSWHSMEKQRRWVKCVIMSTSTPHKLHPLLLLSFKRAESSRCSHMQKFHQVLSVNKTALQKLECFWLPADT